MHYCQCVRRYRANCFALRASTILQNIRNSWGPCPTSFSYSGGAKDHPSASVQAQTDFDLLPLASLYDQLFQIIDQVKFFFLIGCK